MIDKIRDEIFDITIMEHQGWADWPKRRRLLVNIWGEVKKL